MFAPGLALVGDLATDRDTGSTLSLLSMNFGHGTALGPLVAGFLVGFGVVAPVAVGAALAVLGLILVSTQVPEPGRVAPSDRDAPASDVAAPSD